MHSRNFLYRNAWALFALVLISNCASAAPLPEPVSAVLAVSAEPSAYSSEILNVIQAQPSKESNKSHIHGEAMLPYVCPMHPKVQSDKPGQCPQCGMKLQPRQKDMSHEHE